MGSSLSFHVEEAVGSNVMGVLVQPIVHSEEASLRVERAFATRNEDE